MKLWKKVLTLEKFEKKNTLPDTPGVYFFLDAKKELLYIGKATSLYDRVQSYFSRDIVETRGPKINLMFGLTGFIGYKKTDSVLEALILESALIKKHQPLYNTDAKDDKSWNYVVITKEQFPRVLLVRGKELFARHREETKGRRGDPEKRINTRLPRSSQQSRDSLAMTIKYAFGPFTSGSALREAMKIVRKIFPFRDKCKPYGELSGPARIPLKTGSAAGKACFNAQIGLCPGVCTGAITARDYQKIINHIRMFFEGRKNQLIKKLEREMKISAKRLEFEKASEIKKTLFALKHIQDVALIKSESRITNHEFLPAFGGRNRESVKIEAYDVAHLAGSSSVGVMITVQNGKPVKELYKKFILRKKHRGNDLTALQEILERRLKHREWQSPNIIVVDGGDLQVSVAKQAFFSSGLAIPIIGVVKDAKHKPERFIGERAIIKRFQKDILLANSEAHRFAIAFHRHRRRKEFL